MSWAGGLFSPPDHSVSSTPLRAVQVPADHLQDLQLDPLRGFVIEPRKLEQIEEACGGVELAIRSRCRQG